MQTIRHITQGALIGALAIAALLVASGGDATANHVSGSTTRWSVDTDVNGNTATTLGTLDSCVTAAADTDVVVDVTAEDIPAVDVHGTPEVEDDTGGMIGFHLVLTYDGAAMSLVTMDADQLLLSQPGGSLFAPGDELPDSDGTYTLDAVDLGVNPGVTESGSGVLTRLTFHIASTAPSGAYTIRVSDTEPNRSAHYDLQSASLPAPIAYSAQIAVDAPCPGSTMTGDVDCSGAVNAVDGLKILRSGSSLAVVQTEPCNDVGTQSPGVGDVDCSGATNSVDALKILRFGAGLSYAKVHYCENIGT